MTENFLGMVVFEVIANMMQTKKNLGVSSKINRNNQ